MDFHNPRIPTSAFKLAIIFVLLPDVVSAGGGNDEFANNLFSDLAPLLSLFGERVAQQFLSEAITDWSDSIIFAMAPLGIITAVIGAIRVGGPGWLKALVGRAKESMAVAELELLSSTSSDVCEMWNGRAIVRIMGSPPILQLLYIEGSEGADNKLLTLDMKEKFESKSTRELFRHKRIHTDDNGESGLLANPLYLEQYTMESGELATAKREGPNISINLHGRRTKLELRLVACLSVLIQAVVPIYSSVVTYSTRWRRLKGGVLMKPYAFPLTTIGMLLVNIGMMTCATVIGRKTREEKWAPREKDANNKKRRLRIIWIQKCATVNDQLFDSYAIISPYKHKSVMTSRPVHSDVTIRRRATHYAKGAVSSAIAQVNGTSATPTPRQRNVNTDPKEEAVATTGVLLAPTRSLSTGQGRKTSLLFGRYSERAWVLFGASSGIVGFIVQFVGLRAMEWTVSIVHLITIMVMVAVRAFIRRGSAMAMEPITEKLVAGFELEWLAMQSYDGADKIWKDLDADLGKLSASGDGNDRQPRDKVEIGHCCGFGEMEVNGSKELIHNFNPQLDEITSDAAESELSRAHKLVKERVYLRAISKWPCRGARTAVALARAMEVVMNSLFPPKSGIDFGKFTWRLKTVIDGTAAGETEDIHFTIERKGKGKPWVAPASELEAALSLRLYAIHKHHRRHTDNSAQENGNMLEDEDWSSRDQNISLLCPNNEGIRRDFEWWLENGTPIFEASADPPRAKTPSGVDVCGGSPRPITIDVDSYRIFGYWFDYRTKGRHDYSFETVRLEPDMFHRKAPEGDESKIRRKWLVSLSDAPLERAIAQDWYSAFLWSAARECEKLQNVFTRSRREDIRDIGTRPHWCIFRLEDPTITAMAESFQELGLGNMKDAYTRIIAPLSFHDKLPDAERELVSLATMEANNMLSMQDFRQAGRIYLWLFRTCMTFGKKSSAATKATALLLEYFRFVNVVADMWMIEMRDGDLVDKLSTIIGELHEELKNAADSEIVCDLIHLGHVQGRFETVHDLRKYKWPMPPSHLSSRGITYHASLHLSRLHQTIINDDYDKSIRYSKVDLDTVDVFGWSPLHYAAVNGTAEMVGSLLQKLSDTKTRDIMGWTPLHYAALKGNSRTVKALLYGGADPLINGIDGMTPLHCAAQGGNQDIVHQLLEVGSVVDGRDMFGRTPLHWAAYYDHKAAVETLLSRAASVDTADKNGKSSFHLAAMNDNAALMELLTEQTQNRQQRDRDQSSPVHTAAALGNHTVVNLLVFEKSFPPRVEDKNSSQPFHLAAEMGHVEVVEILQKRAEDAVTAEDNDKRTPLHLALRSGARKIVQGIARLVAKQRAMKAEGHVEITSEQVSMWRREIINQARDELRSRALTPEGDWHRASLHDAVALKDRDLVEKLIPLVGDINCKLKDRSTPLHVAVRTGDIDMVRFLIGMGANVNAATIQKMTPLAIAVTMGNIDMCKELLEKADIQIKNRKGDSILHLAIKWCPRLVTILLNLGFDCNVTNNQCNTPLHIAVELGKTDLAKQLLEHGADREAVNADGQTPLYLATGNEDESNALKMVELLLESGANINFRDGIEQQTSLHYAVSLDRLQIVKLLLDYKCDVNILRAEIKLTPLHTAALHGRLECAKLLIQRGANIEARTGNVLRTPLHLAAKHGHLDLTKYLVECGADLWKKDRDGDNALLNAKYGSNGTGKRKNIQVISYLNRVMHAQTEARGQESRTRREEAATPDVSDETVE